MGRFDYGIIGGGIVGLATAHALLERRPDATVVLLEKEREVARHQSGHNSGVVHAGVYYDPGSLKARLCREGNEATLRFCESRGIPFAVCGKLIVATSPLEIERLAALRERCRANRIAVEEVTGGRLREIEPHIRGAAALRVPSSGIVDYRAICAALVRELAERGAALRLGFEAHEIREESRGVTLAASARDAQSSGDAPSGECLQVGHLIACAGLQADRVARLAGLLPRARIVPFRGEYFRLPPVKSGLISHLIYPVPDPRLPFLGVHLTRTIDGSITAGPSAVLGLARERYAPWGFDLRDAIDALAYPGLWRMLAQHWRSAVSELGDSLSKSRFLDRCRKYCPELTVADLEPYPAGIRAQAMLADGTLVHDFLLAETARMTHVLNAPSPAATAALPIGRMLAEKVIGRA
ncbi:MAG: L-2-hydroxyglutarate oxidase [Steroidobacteraceae bacterium]